jgi:glucose/arabinose dehydrogenase
MACAALTFAAHDLAAATLPPGFNESIVATGLTDLTLMQIAPDGRVFVAQQNGTVRVIRRNVLLPAPFIQIQNISTEGERGLMSIAFDPDYAHNRYVYLFYIRASPLSTVVGRVRASASNPNVAEGQPRVVFSTPHRGNLLLNGGGMEVGEDGKLYVGMGDNEAGSGQNLSDLWGKVLRLNLPDGSIPRDNPFFRRTTGANRAIWALGFHNPFTMAVNARTGRIHVNDTGDSGETSREEVNHLRRGVNYGWPDSQGPRSFFNYSAAAEGGFAIVGGDFYTPRVCMFPARYQGKYFFADVGGWIRFIDGDHRPGPLMPFADGIDIPTDVEVHPDGSLYYTARGSGTVQRVTFNH